MSFRLPADARDKLWALSKVRRQPQWRIIVESVDCYLRELPRREQMRIKNMRTSRNS